MMYSVWSVFCLIYLATIHFFTQLIYCIAEDRSHIHYFLHACYLHHHFWIHHTQLSGGGKQVVYVPTDFD
ncbi:hypothetical protein EON63_05160 [archaeon]|nr:MAG: hypothetical protein EON63_05160 [archaeon]